MTFSRLSRWLALPVLLFFALPIAAQTTYYVDETDGGASDSNDGSSGTPWLTISKCASTMTAGDTCVIKDTAGTYAGFTETTSGTSGNRITYQCAGSTPEINGEIGISADYLNIFDCRFHTTSGVRSIRIGGTTTHTYMWIAGNTFENSGIGVIGGCFSRSLFENNTFAATLSNDIHIICGEYNVIRNSTSPGTACGGGTHCDFLQSAGCVDGGSHPSSYDHSIIERNTLLNWDSSDEHFQLSNDTDGCLDGEAVIGLLLRFNKIYNINSGSSFTVLDNGSCGGGCTPTNHNHVYNNDVADAASPSETFSVYYVASQNSTVKNNLFADAMIPTNATGANLGSGGTVGCNLYYDKDQTMTFASPASTESGAVKNMDPILTDPANGDFSIDGMSPAVDTGCSLGTTSGTGSTSTALTLADPYFFQDGFGGGAAVGVMPDCIAIGTVSNVACIVEGSVDYDQASGTYGDMTLDAPLSWSDSDPVWLYSDSDGTVVISGGSPDIGAVEYMGADTTDPTIISTSPTDNETDVAVSVNIVVTFSEDVAKGTGNITIVETGVGIFEQIAIGDASISISGPIMTINPAGTMGNSTSYHLTIDATAIDDLAGNSFAGISDTTTLNWTTKSLAGLPAPRTLIR